MLKYVLFLLSKGSASHFRPSSVTKNMFAMTVHSYKYEDVPKDCESDYREHLILILMTIDIFTTR